MKRFLFMLVSLLCATAQVWADKVTDLSQLSNDKVYFIKSERAFLLYSEANAGKLSTSSGKTVGTVQEDLADPMQQFQIIKNGNNLYLFSVGAQKYVGANGNISIGVGTVGGMLIGTIALIVIVPALFIVFQYIEEKVMPNRRKEIADSETLSE